VHDRHGGVHFQLGKYYDYRALVSDPAWAILESVKRTVDPNLVFNRGALGL